MTFNRRSFSACAMLMVAPVPIALRAEVARVEISRRQDVLGGKAFGTVGAYEKLAGKVYYAVAPENPHNRIIADLDKAPRNSQGKVEFSADVFIMRPKDTARGNGVLLFDLVNRGRMTLLNIFNHGTMSADPATEAEFGDGFLMRQGYTLVSIGWQFDVPKRDGLIGFDPPVASEHGQPITGWVNPWFIPNKRSESFEYASGYFSPAYPTIEPQNPDYRLTEREGWVAAPRLIPRGAWQFGRVEKGQVVNDPNWVSLKGGFKAGMTYQVTYEAKNPPVAGLGFAAIRDLAAALKHDPAAIAPGRYAYTYGASQTGRYQRHLIYEGFTTDEQGRQAIDALFIQTGGTGNGSFNERFAQPDELGSFTQTKFPIRYETTTDPATGKRDGLGARVPAGQEPKIFLIDTGSEYWDRGRVAALRHLSMDGTEDLADPPNMRVFLFAGTQHGPGTWPPRDNGGQLKSNPNDYRWLESSLLSDLDRWVRRGSRQPPSRHPTLADATLVAQSKIESSQKCPASSGRTMCPAATGSICRVRSPLCRSWYREWMRDGNDVGGLRTPELAVPLGTYTDWDFRSESIGSPDTLIAMAGSFIPFAKTRAEREKSGDPRLSIEERYPNRADYLRRVEEAANRLVQERYVLPEHVKTIVEEAGQHWDWMMSQTTASAQR